MMRRLIIGFLLACMVLPVIVLGRSPADAVHGLGGPFQGLSGATATR